MEQALGVIGHRWTALLVWHLRDGTKRHAQLAALLPRITPKVLTERLRTLEGLGAVERTVHAAVPVRVEYTLTAHGLRLGRILDELEAWGKDTEALGTRR
ncbi:HTH-type transcriptional activator HxlR [Deinococcus carri]|uniref:HTH-type transcriptional activator HxlR n=1 Tax=Deinococcus carri TaxID=1211323 RepID=A0ABP9WCD1_9DEIO